MKSISLLLATFLARGLGQQVQEFAFTQCECENGAFPPSGDSIVSLASLVPTDDTFDCGALGGAAGSNGFPDTSGITINTEDAVLEAGTISTGSNFLIIFRTVSPDAAGLGTMAFLNLDDGSNEYELRASDDEIQFRFEGDPAATLVDLIDTDYTSAVGAFDDAENAGQSFFFVCGAATGSTPSCVVSDISFASPGAGATLVLMERGGNTLDASLKGLRIETGLALTAANLVTEVTASFSDLAVTPVVPPVDEIALTFTTAEDTEAEFDLNDALEENSASGVTFALADVTNLDGDITTALDADLGTFTFDPTANFSETRTFTMNYGIDTCVNSGITLSLEVTPVNDAPDVNNEITLEVFAAARVGFASVENIAFDVDFPDTNIIPESEGATVTVTPPTGVEFSAFSGGVCSTTAETSFTIADSAVTFCILAPDALFEGTVEVPISVDDQNGGVTAGILTLQGSPPISVDPEDLENAPEANGDEGDQVTITVANLVNAEVTEASAFAIQVTSLPDATAGSLFLDGAEQTSVPFNVAQGADFTFVPAEGVFNAFVDDLDDIVSRGSDNVLIGDCEDNERDEDDFCPITFNYIGTFGEFESADVGTVSLFVTAVDDLDTSLSLLNEEDDELIVEADEGDINAFGSFPEIVLTSDNGESVFAVELEIIANGAANFQFTDNPSGLEVVNAEFNGAERANCEDFQCTSATVRTTPNQFITLLNSAIINVDLDSDLVNPTLTMQVDGNADFVEVTYVVQINQEGFFEDPANVGIVAGSATGFVAFVIGLTLFRVRRAENLKAQREIAEATLNVQDEIDRGVIRKPDSEKPSSRKKEGSSSRRKEGSSSRKKDGSSSRKKGSGGAKGVEQVGQGWEKHYDAKNKAYFYYNPQTDTTQWDMPEDLSGRKQRLGTQDLNL